jgi:hypothetical protein
LTTKILIQHRKAGALSHFLLARFPLESCTACAMHSSSLPMQLSKSRFQRSVNSLNAE